MSSLVTNAKEPEVFGCADFDSECVHCLVWTEAEGAVERGTCNTAQHNKVAVHRQLILTRGLVQENNRSVIKTVELRVNVVAARCVTSTPLII